MAFVVIELGSLLVEILGERRKVKVNVPGLLDDFQEKNIEELIDEIEKSGLFRQHRWGRATKSLLLEEFLCSAMNKES